MAGDFHTTFCKKYAKYFLMQFPCKTCDGISMSISYVK